MAKSSTSSVYEDDLSSLTSTPTIDTRWLDLSKFSEYIKRNGWEHRLTPDELTQFPEDVVVPQILQDIITWSLISGSNWSHPPLKNQPPSSTHSIQRSLSEISKRKSHSSTLSKGDTQTPASSVENVSVSSYQTSLTRINSRGKRKSSGEDKNLAVKCLTTVSLNESTESSVQNETHAECISCFDEFVVTEMVLLPSCRHWYCKDCLNTLVITAMATEASFPPKCCLSAIPLQQILKTLSAKQRETYQEKAAEYAIPTTDRWYCPNKTCLKWIPATSLKLNQQTGYDCPHCSAKLCRTCRGDAHPTNTECPQDFGLEATLETAEIEGWQRCYSCRALVEHNTGCRHMTCRCRAQFCYVCGLRWQTCSCTEADAANKRNAAQARRQERTTRRDEEAAEIARAIAEVEAMERREAEERRLEEERRQREEEEQLLALEALRLLEEAKRREDEARAESEFRAALVRSFREEWSAVEDMCRKIQTFQIQKINCRHGAEDARLTELQQDGETDARERFHAFSQMLVQNGGWRQRRLASGHMKEQEELTNRHEEEEDSTFIQAQIRLRGKPNRESRLEKMMGEVHSQHEEERLEMTKKHDEESNSVKKKIEIDKEGLQRWYYTKIQEVGDQQKAALRKFGHTVGADRQYCEIVFERREQMLAKHAAMSLASIEAGSDPIGLTEFEASKVEPFLPGLNEGEAGPSGTSRNQKGETDRFYAQVSSFASPSEPHMAVLPKTPREATVSNIRDYSPVIPGSFPADTSPVLPTTQPARLLVPTHPPNAPPPPPVVPKPLSLHKPMIDSHKPNTSPPVPVRFTPQRQQAPNINFSSFAPLTVSSLGARIASWGGLDAPQQGTRNSAQQPSQFPRSVSPMQSTTLLRENPQGLTVSSYSMVTTTAIDSPVSPMSPAPASVVVPPPPPRSSERLTLQRAAAARAEKKNNILGTGGGKWAFLSRHQQQYMSEEEMKHRLQNTMGDASLSSPFRFRVK